MAGVFELLKVDKDLDDLTQVFGCQAFNQGSADLVAEELIEGL